MVATIKYLTYDVGSEFKVRNHKKNQLSNDKRVKHEKKPAKGGCELSSYCICLLLDK